MKGKLIAAAVVLVVLAGAFWAVDRNAERRGAAFTADSSLKETARKYADTINVERKRADSIHVIAQRDSIAAVAAIAKADAAKRRADSLAKLVRVTGPTTITVRDTEYVVPPEIPERLRADSVARAAAEAALVASRAENASLRQENAASNRLVVLWEERTALAEQRVLNVGSAEFARGRSRGRVETVSGVVGVVVAILGAAAAVK